MLREGAATVRPATEADVGFLIDLMAGLAAYEATIEGGYAGEVTVTPEALAELLFEERSIGALVAEDGRGRIVGCATYFQIRSTWTGAPCLYLEDLFVDRRARGAGIGRALMASLASLCETQGLKRIDWICSASNEPSLGFYEGLGAVRMDGCLHHRLSGDALAALAKEAR